MKTRIGIYSVDFVLINTIRGISKAKTKKEKLTIKKKNSRVFEKVNVYFASDRYDVFAEKGCKCINCGIEGTYFALEGDLNNKQNRYHFNLYAINPEGKEVLMTKDHHYPKSKGGEDIISNYEPMCEICNSSKGSKIVA